MIPQGSNQPNPEFGIYSSTDWISTSQWHEDKKPQMEAGRDCCRLRKN